mgnify:CR=1 FL=1
MTWPLEVDWKQLRYGVELEFVGGNPDEVELPPGWTMLRDERQVDEQGRLSGAELTSPPLAWDEREQIRLMAERLKRSGACANWSCGLHVHIDLSAWGEAVIPPLLDAALRTQDALRRLLRTADHRLVFCPPLTPAMRARHAANPGGDALHHSGRPQSHRCGINARAWYDNGTVEIRYANGSLEFGEIARTVELCLRWTAAVGAGGELPDEPEALARALGAPPDGYPPPMEPPLWHLERMWLEDMLIPALTPLVRERMPDGEIHTIRPAPGGLLDVDAEDRSGSIRRFAARPAGGGWELKELPEEADRSREA